MNEQTAHSAPQKPRPSLRDYLELVKFSHTVFALPFALAGMLVAAKGRPSLLTFVWILVAMVGARTAAMGFNRIVDRGIDAINPRTQGREIPAGKVSVSQAAILVALAAALFCFAAWQLNMLAFWLSFPTLAVLFFYSYCKRFTPFAHFVLGICLGIAPVGAWVAVRGGFDEKPVVLALGILFWVAGFDVIYATMDDEFDRRAGLRSLVQTLGVPRALLVARICHALFIVLLVLFGWLVGLPTVYYFGIAAIALFLIYEHSLVKSRDLRKINAAFFTVNGAIAIFFLLLISLSLWVMYLAPQSTA
jgi:4-hydroxybenzoate polyprenyltransferase